MNILIIGCLAILSYLSASGFILKELIDKQANVGNGIRLAWLAGGLHASYILAIFQSQNGLNFSFFNTAVLVALCIVTLILFAALDKPVEKLGIGIFPLAALLLALDMTFPEKTHPLQAQDWPMAIHVLSSIIAFSLLNIAALQAVLLALQDQQLRRHQPRKLMLALPPLQAMETLLFQMIGVGLLFLTGSLISGFVFIEDLFAQHLVHKTVLSLVAWVIFSGLLIGRIRYGWRGTTAIQWTLIGFALLLLAYFGSKLVLELILNRT